MKSFLERRRDEKKCMNQYQDEKRGTFQNQKEANQKISYEGMRFTGRNGIANVTPTDIDGLIQLDAENAIIFFELKHHGGMPIGQKTALTKIVDEIHCKNETGTESVLFLATHGKKYTETIIAKDAIVTDYYYEERWYRPKKKKDLLYWINSYISFTKSKKAGKNDGFI